MLEKQEKFVPEFFPNSNSYTIHKDCQVFEDGKLIASGRHSTAFTCDMLEEMKAYIGDDNHHAVKAASVMWTPEVIAEYKQRMAAQEAALNEQG